MSDLAQTIAYALALIASCGLLAAILKAGRDEPTKPRSRGGRRR